MTRRICPARTGAAGGAARRCHFHPQNRLRSASVVSAELISATGCSDESCGTCFMQLSHTYSIVYSSYSIFSIYMFSGNILSYCSVIIEDFKRFSCSA